MSPFLDLRNTAEDGLREAGGELTLASEVVVAAAALTGAASTNAA
jgi:hypothetical protein